MSQVNFQLRAPELADMATYRGFILDPEVNCWLDDRAQRPMSYADVEGFIFSQVWCPWSIEINGEFVGLTALTDFDPIKSQARFFIVIGSRHHWGMGIGSAVAKEVVRRGFVDLGLRKIVSDYLAPNLASKIIHQRCGFHIDGILPEDSWRRGAWVDKVLLSYLQHEFPNV